MEPIDLTALAAEHLAAARAASNGRSSTKLVGDHTRLLRKNLIAIKAGRVHCRITRAPGRRRSLVLEGQIEFRADGESVTLDAGQHDRDPADAARSYRAIGLRTDSLGCQGLAFRAVAGRSRHTERDTPTR